VNMRATTGETGKGSLLLWKRIQANQCRSQADHVYGYATICFMCAVIGVYSLTHWGFILTHRWHVYRSRVWLRIRALIRYLSCKLFYIKLLDWCSPSLGVMILGAVGLIFFFCKHTIDSAAQIPITLSTDLSSPFTGTRNLLLARRP
jgi:hypothetical protein